MQASQAGYMMIAGYIIIVLRTSIVNIIRICQESKFLARKTHVSEKLPGPKNIRYRAATRHENTRYRAAARPEKHTLQSSRLA